MLTYLSQEDRSFTCQRCPFARERTAPGSGWASGTAPTRAAANVVDMVGLQVRTFGLPARVVVSGWRIQATLGRKR